MVDHGIGPVVPPVLRERRVLSPWSGTVLVPQHEESDVVRALRGSGGLAQQRVELTQVLVDVGEGWARPWAP